MGLRTESSSVDCWRLRRYAAVWRLPRPALARASRTQRRGVRHHPRPAWQSLGPPPPPPMWGPPPTDVGTATSAAASLYPVPSLRPIR